jgi:hypothetical protein
VNRLYLILMLACLAHAKDATSIARDLDAIAKVATVMIDGDICQRILTPRAIEYMLRNPSRDKWADADNYDVDDVAFIATKKTLIRLSRLAEYPVDANLWMPLKSDLSIVHVVIRNRYEMSQFWPWGKLFQTTPAPMREVLETGRRSTVTGKAGYVSVLAPVHNSLGDIVGLVEVVSRVEPDSRENVK